MASAKTGPAPGIWTRSSAARALLTKSLAPTKGGNDRFLGKLPGYAGQLPFGIVQLCGACNKRARGVVRPPSSEINDRNLLRSQVPVQHLQERSLAFSTSGVGAQHAGPVDRLDQAGKDIDRRIPIELVILERINSGYGDFIRHACSRSRLTSRTQPHSWRKLESAPR